MKFNFIRTCTCSCIYLAKQRISLHFEFAIIVSYFDFTQAILMYSLKLQDYNCLFYHTFIFCISYIHFPAVLFFQPRPPRTRGLTPRWLRQNYSLKLKRDSRSSAAEPTESSTRARTRARVKVYPPFGQFCA